MYLKEIESIKDLDIYFKYKTNNNVYFKNDCLNISSLKIKTIIKFNGFENIPYLPADNLFFGYNFLKYEQTSRSKYKYSETSSFVLTDNRFSNIYYSKNKHSIDKYNINNHYRTKNSFYVVTKFNLSYKKYVEELTLNYNHNHKFQLNAVYDFNVKKDRKEVKKLYLEWYEKHPVKTKFFLGKAYTIYKYKKTIHDYVLQKTKPFHVLSDIEIQQLINQEKQNRKRNTDKTKVFYKYSRLNHRYETTIAELSKYFIVFYTNDTNNDSILYKTYQYETLLKDLKWKNKIKFIVLNDTNYNKCKKLKNLVHVNNFFDVNNFTKYFNKIHLYNKYKEVSGFTNIERISKYYDSININLKEQLRCSKDCREQFFNHKDQILEVIKRNNTEHFHLEKQINELHQFYAKVDVLNYVTEYIPDIYLTEILKNKKILKLNENLYGSKS